MPRYLCYFVHRHLDFRIPELESLHRLALQTLGDPEAASSPCPGGDLNGTSSQDPEAASTPRSREEARAQSTSATRHATDAGISVSASTARDMDQDSHSNSHSRSQSHSCCNCACDCDCDCETGKGRHAARCLGAEQEQDRRQEPPAGPCPEQPRESLLLKPQTPARPRGEAHPSQCPGNSDNPKSKSPQGPAGKGTGEEGEEGEGSRERGEEGEEGEGSGERGEEGEGTGAAGARAEQEPPLSPALPGASGKAQSPKPQTLGSEEDAAPQQGRLRWWKPEGDPEASPFFYAELPSDAHAEFIARRGILLKGVYEVWGEGLTWQDLEASLRACPPARMAPFLGPESTFKIVVDGFGRAVPHPQQLELIERLAFMPFQGKVDLRNPQHSFWLVLCNPPSNDASNLTANGLPPDLQPRFFFGRQVALSDRADLVTKYELSQRRYLGPTAMDAELALIMANQALARPGSLVYDPFVGTGSVLVAAAHFGATTMGADIDLRTIREGKGPGRNIWDNFKQYGLSAPAGVIRADNNCPPWRKGLTEVFHGIVCDPPYGVRAGGRKSGGRKLLNGQLSSPYVIPEELRDNHIPSTAPYSLSECLHDLLDVAASLLSIGGRLVFFYPALRDTYSDSEVPQHECLRIVANSEQILTRVWSRRLITMEKIRPYTEEMGKKHEEAHLQFRTGHREFLRRDAERIAQAEALGAASEASDSNRRGSDLAFEVASGPPRELRDVVFKTHRTHEHPAMIHREGSIKGMSNSKDHESVSARKQRHSRPSFRAKCV